MDTNYWDGCYKQRYFDKPTQDEIEGECAGTDSVNRTHKKKLSRKLTRLFGTVIANRIGYGGRKINTLFPLDGEFNLPAQQYSLSWTKTGILSMWLSICGKLHLSFILRLQHSQNLGWANVYSLSLKVNQVQLPQVWAGVRLYPNSPPNNVNPWIPVLDIYLTMPNTSNMTIT